MATYTQEDRYEFGELYKKIQDLEERNKKLSADLMRKSAEASEAKEILERWHMELDLLADQKGHNLCWVGIPKLLKNTIGYRGKYPDIEGVTKEEFRAGCDVYTCELFGK